MSILKVSTNILTSNTAHLEQIINNLVYKKTLQQIIILFTYILNIIYIYTFYSQHINFYTDLFSIICDISSICRFYTDLTVGTTRSFYC